MDQLVAQRYADFKTKKVMLLPVPVSITGIEVPLLIHQFTMSEMEQLEKDRDEDPEVHVRKQVLRFLNGLDVEITKDDCDELGKFFAGWQVREIFTKALKLNGFGPEAMREAEKN